MIIRKAKSSDCKSLSKLAHTPELLSSLAPIDLESYFKKIAGKNELFLVAENNKEIAGFILGEELLSKCAYGHLMAVDNKFRGQGIGGKLLDALKNKAKEHKIQYLFLFAPDGDANLVEFYKSHHFNRKGKYVLFDTKL